MLIDVAGMSLAFIMQSISSRDRKVLVCAGCFCDLRKLCAAQVIHAEEG